MFLMPALNAILMRSFAKGCANCGAGAFALSAKTYFSMPKARKLRRIDDSATRFFFPAIFPLPRVSQRLEA